MKKTSLILLSILTLCCSTYTGLVSHAQDARPVISVGVPDYFVAQFKDTVLPHLEQTLPNVRINLVSISPPQKAPDATWIDEYYKQVEAEVSAADVLLITPLEVTPESTRAGYFLDLKPLIDADTSFDSADFVPGVRKAFQWDSSTWALPAFFSPRFIVYDPAAFDQAGLTYPDDTWTMDQFATAARQLTIKGTDDGNDISGLFVDEPSLSIFFRALLGESFYDNTASPLMPRLASPQLANLLQTWADLEAEGSATTQVNSDVYEKIPLRLGSGFDLEDRSNVSGGDQRTLAAALLPGKFSMLDVFGLAISKGTSQPDQSYQVLKALTALPDLRALFGGALSARSSAQALTADGEYQLHISSEERAFIESAAQSGLRPADLLFGNYLPNALSRVKAGDNSLAALQMVEAQASQIMQAADQKRDTVSITVATSIPDVAPNGKLTLTFGIFTGDTTMPVPLEWKQAVDDFIATDPQVGQIKLEFVPPVTMDWANKVQDFPNTTDCFYPTCFTLDAFTGKVLSLDALMDADPNFSRDDVLNGVLRDLERDNHEIGFPLSVTPAMLRYNIQKFEAAGVPLPTNGWTVDEFASALTALKAQNPKQPVLYPDKDFGRYLLMLMAAYGALPIDWRADPVTVNYTDPDTVETIRQVLDLAKDDTIRYAKTAAFIFTIKPVDTPLVIEDFSALSAVSKTSGLTTFPSGTEFTPMAYRLNTGYISASTPAPEACYRWLQALAHHPKLFPGMPALRSVISDPAIEALYGKDIVAAFQRFDQTLSAPNAIIVHDRLDKLGVATLWLLRAFDNYVLKDADLEQELAQAEQFTKEYMACVTAMGQPIDKTVPNGIFVEDKCSNKIDPTFLDIFMARS